VTFKPTAYIQRALIGLAASLAMLTGAHAEQNETGVPEAFRGDTPESTLSVSYADLSRMLKLTVLETGLSDRAHPGRLATRRGSRIVNGNKKATRNEGNLIDFHSFMGDNLEVLVALRQDLEAVPSAVPLSEFSRNEQLAYWLNLYNLTVITQVTSIFPETNLKKYHPKMWDEKVLNVAGIPLSLNDIHHKILIPKYRNPLVMYGLFQGFTGGPNIRDEAYTANKVWRQLEANAAEFVNSNRGARIVRGRLYTSYFYEENAALFPQFEDDLKRHLMAFATPAFADRIDAHDGSIKPTQTDWYVADLYGGNRAISSASNGVPGLIAAFGGDDAWTAFILDKAEIPGNLPAHVARRIKQINIKNAKQLREGNVDIEEFNAAAPEPATEPDKPDTGDNPDQ